jgi:hypothetical protein
MGRLAAQDTFPVKNIESMIVRMIRADPHLAIAIKNSRIIINILCK